MYSINDCSASAPLNFPWSQSFYLCCEDVRCPVVVLSCDAYRDQIRDFVHRFYQFVEGVSQHHRNVDELLSKVSNPPFPSIVK